MRGEGMPQKQRICAPRERPAKPERTRKAWSVSMNNSLGSRSDSNGASAHSPGDSISQILKNSRTIAVVGLSSRRHRPSFGVSEYMQSAGYRIIPVNPSETEVLGEKCYARLEDIPEAVDIVNIFRRSEFVPEIVESAIRIGARCSLDAGRRRTPGSRRASAPRGTVCGDELLHPEGTHQALPAPRRVTVR